MSRSVRTRLLPAIIAFALCLPFAQAQNVELPDMGSSAGSLLSPEEESRYGARMLYELRRVDMVLEDALLDDYIHALGYRLVALSERPEQEFTFFVVRSDEINAFAAPGGYVGINVGLMHTADLPNIGAAWPSSVAYLQLVKLQLLTRLVALPEPMPVTAQSITPACSWCSPQWRVAGSCQAASPGSSISHTQA